MKKYFYSLPRVLTTVLLAEMVLAGCTENPFFQEDEITNRSIRGQVELMHNDSPDDVYVWLSGFEIGCRTDENGSFNLKFPSGDLQSGNGGVNEELALYFFMADYVLDSLTVLFVNGEIAPGQYSVDKSGLLKKPIEMQKLLHSSTTIDPSVVMPDSQQVFSITTVLQADNDKVAKINSLTKVVSKVYNHTGFLFKNLNTGSIQTIYTLPGYDPTDWYVGADTLTVRETDYIVINSIDFPAGEYEVIHYTTVIQDGIPPALLQSLGEHATELHPDYLNYPFKRTGGYFTVTN